MKKRDKVYKHITAVPCLVSRNAGEICGDVTLTLRSPEATTVVLCDGMGHGIKANIAATMAASRMKELFERGFSQREVAERLAGTMHAARTEDVPFAAFTAARILNDGNTTVITYEMPPPLMIEHAWAYVPQQHFYSLGNEVVGETRCVLRPGESLLLVSDGVTQAGLGGQIRGGWTIQGVCSFINAFLGENSDTAHLPATLVNEAVKISGSAGDDTSAILLSCRPGTTVTVLSGPPANRLHDQRIVNEFMESDGLRVVCGSTTAEIVARVLNRPVKMDHAHESPFLPPSYAISGIDLVTEGAITLNQAYNLLDMPLDKDRDNPAVKLRRMLMSADRVRFRIGGTVNTQHDHAAFRQLGILPRTEIIPLIAAKLRSKGKLVIIEPL